MVDELKDLDLTRIVAAVARCTGEDLADIDPLRVASRTISGLYDGATTAELDRLSIQTAVERMFWMNERPAMRILAWWSPFRPRTGRRRRFSCPWWASIRLLA